MSGRIINGSLITDRDRAVPKEEVPHKPYAEAGRTPTRARIPLTERIGRLFTGIREQWKQKATRDRLGAGRQSLWAATPESLTELKRYLVTAPWVPSGEHAPWLEFAGRAYGYLVAIPASAALFLITWLIQRPTRLTVALIVGFLLRVTR